MEYNNAKLEYADGGFILTWDETHREGKGEYSASTYKQGKKVFPTAEGKKALAKLCEYSGMEMGHNDDSMKEDY